MEFGNDQGDDVWQKGNQDIEQQQFETALEFPICPPTENYRHCPHRYVGIDKNPGKSDHDKPWWMMDIELIPFANIWSMFPSVCLLTTRLFTSEQPLLLMASANVTKTAAWEITFLCENN